MTSGYVSHMHLTGKERDFESGLDNFGARFDSSQFGRFMSPDPNNDSGFENQDDPQSWNAYLYVRDNPLILTDPDGRDYLVCIENGSGLNCTAYRNYYDFHKDVNSAGGTLDGDRNSGQILVNGKSIGVYQYFVGPGVEGGGTSEDNILAPIAAGGLYGGIKAGVRGIAEGLFGGGARTALEDAAVTTATESAGTAISEVETLATRAASTVGNQSVQASSRQAAEEAAAKWVGDGARDIVDRQTGRVVGKISADGTKVARFTSVNKPQPYINLVNKATGGNLHVRF